MDNLHLDQKILVTGHNGMVGSAVVRELKNKGFSNVVTIDKNLLDLTHQEKVYSYLQSNKFDVVFMAAAKVGGIKANSSFPADFIYNNLSVQLNIIHGSFLSGVKKLLFLGSSCIYPKLAHQPISENSLLTGPLEETNEPYALSKICGIKMCESYNIQYKETHNLDYRSLMPTNLYGPGDNYNLDSSHVIPALIRKFHEAKSNNLKSVTIWGSGKVKRDFLHVDDMARASIFFMNIDKDDYYRHVANKCSHINIGSGQDISIYDLAYLIADIIGYKQNIIFDESMPDGPPRKILDNALANKMGWSSSISLQNGLIHTYKKYVEGTTRL